MITLVCGWGGDLSVGPAGDINVTQVQSDAQNRIIRRLLTSPGDYIWHCDYGAGLGRYVGQPYSSSQISATVRNQLRLEPLVATSPTPSIEVRQSPDNALSTISVSISYQLAGSGTQDLASLTLGTD